MPRESGGRLRCRALVVPAVLLGVLAAGCGKKSGPAATDGSAAGPAKTGGAPAAGAPSAPAAGSGPGAPAAGAAGSPAAPGVATAAASDLCGPYVEKFVGCTRDSLAGAPGLEGVLDTVRETAVKSCGSWKPSGEDKLAAAIDACKDTPCGDGGGQWLECITGRMTGEAVAGAAGAAGGDDGAAGEPGAAAFAPPGPGTDPLGSWRIAGRTLRGQAYRGQVDVRRSGDVYDLVYDTTTTSGARPGVGFFLGLGDGGHLFAAQGSPGKDIAIVLYRIAADGTLTGTWTTLAGAGALGTETARGGSGPDPTGSYDVTGTDPSGSGYTATLVLSTDGRSYEAQWTYPESVENGVGLRYGEWLAVAFGEGESCAINHYTFQGGRASGTFAMLGHAGLGSEDLTASTGGAVAGGGPSGGSGGGSQYRVCGYCAQDAVEGREYCERCRNEACMDCFARLDDPTDPTGSCLSTCESSGRPAGRPGSGGGSSGRSAECEECWATFGNEDDCSSVCP